MDGCPLGLELVVEDKPTEFSCNWKKTLSCGLEHAARDLYIPNLVPF